MGEKAQPVWLETWSADGPNLKFCGPTHDSVRVADIQRLEREFEALAPERARLAAAAPAMVRALLVLADTRAEDRRACCASDPGYGPHQPDCIADQALKAAGFQDQWSRDAARRRLRGSP